MNNGNGILKWNSVELESVKRLFFKEEDLLFVNFINGFSSALDAASFMADNRWIILSSILNLISSHYDTGFFVYENPCGLLFDVTAQIIRYREE